MSAASVELMFRSTHVDKSCRDQDAGSEAGDKLAEPLEAHEVRGCLLSREKSTRVNEGESCSVGGRDLQEMVRYSELREPLDYQRERACCCFKDQHLQRGALDSMQHPHSMLCIKMINSARTCNGRLYAPSVFPPQTWFGQSGRSRGATDNNVRGMIVW